MVSPHDGTPPAGVVRPVDVAPDDRAAVGGGGARRRERGRSAPEDGAVEQAHAVGIATCERSRDPGALGEEAAVLTPAAGRAPKGDDQRVDEPPEQPLAPNESL